MPEQSGDAVTETETTETTTATTTAAETGKAEKDWQAEAEKYRKFSREWEARAKANSSAAEKLAALEESQKTEAQKIAERAEAAERRAAEADRELARYRVAAAKKLPAELVGRLQGDTDEELAADADTLLALVKASTSLKPDPSQGNRTSASAKADPAQEFADIILRQRGINR
jgi:hypothetical protein